MIGYTAGEREGEVTRIPCSSPHMNYGLVVTSRRVPLDIRVARAPLDERDLAEPGPHGDLVETREVVLGKQCLFVSGLFTETEWAQWVGTPGRKSFDVRGLSFIIFDAESPLADSDLVEGVPVPTPIWEFFEEGSSCFASPRRNDAALYLLRLAEEDEDAALHLLRQYEAAQAASTTRLRVHQGAVY